LTTFIASAAAAFSAAADGFTPYNFNKDVLAGVTDERGLSRP
jgi:hypothetical protein